MNRELLDLLICPFSKSSLTLDTFEAKDDEVEYGMLHSEAGDFPIVAGIPILLWGKTDLLALVRAGKHQEALTMALIGKAPDQGVGQINKYLQETTWFSTLGTWLEEKRQRTWERKAEEQFFPKDGGPVDAHRFFDLGLGTYHMKKPSFVNYNYYRFGCPSYLVALSFVEAMGTPKGLVLDVGCGAGHVIWAIQQRMAPQPTIGIDYSFFSLYMARTRVAPHAWLICGDATALPFHQGVFAGVFSSDAFYFIPNKWGALKEIERVLMDSGTMMLTGLRNKLAAHKPVGNPLTPQGYQKLVGHLSSRIIPDSHTVHRYLDGYGVPAAEQVDEATLDESFAVSIWAGKRNMEFADMGRFEQWPHALGELAVNPLYMTGPSNDAGTVYLRRYPLDAYTNINPQVKSYLPELFRLTKPQAGLIHQNCTKGLEELLERWAVLGFPPGYLH